MKPERFSIKKRLKSFKHAFSGLKILIQEEHNSRIHIFSAIAAMALGLFFGISKAEWLWVSVSIIMVFSAELFNSAIENLADGITKEKNPLIKKAKDLGAAGVLVMAIGAAIIGSIIFFPYIISYLETIM